MAKAKYNDPLYQAIRKGWAPVVASGQATCYEVVCLMPTRVIHAGSKWDLAHDTTGTKILGPAHRRCNRSEGATRGNRAREPRFLTL